MIEDQHELPVTGTKCRLPDTMSGTDEIFISGAELSKFFSGKGAVTLTKCEYAKKFLLNSKTIDRNRKLNEYLPMAGNGLVTSEGSFHHWQRRLLNKAFLPEQLVKYYPKFVSYANLLAEVKL